MKSARMEGKDGGRMQAGKRGRDEGRREGGRKKITDKEEKKKWRTERKEVGRMKLN